MEYQKVCIVGAGTMGWSISQVFAAAGYHVLLCDRDKGLAKKGRQALHDSLAVRVERGKMEQAELDTIMGNITPGVYEDAIESEFLLEAIYENLEAKQELFKKMEEIVPEDCIMASNTSTLSITALGSALKDPSRFAGMHFFNPPTVMELIEVISGTYSSPKVLKAVTAMAKQLGKTPIGVQESPGFVVNRILVPLINEAVFVLGEGVASAEDIDTAMRLGANHPMGPLALGDLIGLDVTLNILDVLHQETGDPKYRAHTLLRRMVRAGKLGRKTGEGFFKYK